MATLKLSFLGPPRVELDSDPIGIDTRKAIGLLAYLAATAETYNRETLATLLWPASDRHRAMGALRYTLFQLRKAIGDRWILSDRHSLGLDWTLDIQVDVAQFQHSVAVLDRPNPDDDSCIATVTGAVELYRDDFLSGFYLDDCPDFEEWQRLTAETLNHRLCQALEWLVNEHHHRQQFAPAIHHARRWLALVPWHEPAHAWLIQLYAQDGQRTAALRQYEVCVEQLEEELGVEPAESTRDLLERIQAGELAPAHPPAPEREVPSGPPNNLPPQPTSFVGREKELNQIQTYLGERQRRLLTLAGPGGIGKTRLAQQVAQQALESERFPHGVYFVSLVGTRSSDYLVTTIADAMGLSLAGSEEPLQQLLAYLQGRQLLLVLDNFEHLIATGAMLLTHLLEAVPSLQLLVTSRENLNLMEEWLLEICGLPYPETELDAEQTHDAINLFVERARQVNPDFDPQQEPQGAEAVRRICRLVEGMPLALELAAAWTRRLPCLEIAGEIEQNLDFLSISYRNLPGRHRGLRAIFEQSWQRLSDREREALAQLAVFRDEFSREAATQVTRVSLPVTATLIDKSLLRRTDADRYSLHELLRQYAAEKLETQPDVTRTVRERHARYYAELVKEKQRLWDGQHEQQALTEIQAEIQNVRAGWEWAVHQQDETILDIYLEPLYDFHAATNRYWDGKELFDRAITTLIGANRSVTGNHDRRSHFQARLLARQAQICFDLGLFDETSALLKESMSRLERFQDNEELALVHELAGQVLNQQGDYAAAVQHLEQSLAFAEKTENHARTAHALLSLSATTLMQGEYDAAHEWGDRCLALYQRLNKTWGIAQALRILGEIAQALADTDRAEQLHQQSLALFQKIDNPIGITMAYHNLGRCACDLNRYRDAHYYLRRGLWIALENRITPPLLRVMLDIAALIIKVNATDGPDHPLSDPEQQEGDLATALQILTMVLHHSATDQRRQRRARTMLAEVATSLPPETVTEVQEKARTQTLEELAGDLLLQRETPLAESSTG